MLGFLSGIIAGLFCYLVARIVLAGFFTVQQNERAVLTSFGRAQRIEGRTSLDSPVAEHLNEEQRDRYRYPQVRVIGPGGPYFKWPWQKVHKVDVAIQTVNAAYDPEVPSANHNNTMLDAVTKDQLNIGIRGQLRYKVSAHNLYAYLFGVRHPIAHVMGYFVSVLRERIATFEANNNVDGLVVDESATGALAIEGISINDLRKNLNEVNLEMDRECLSSAARYGVVLDASLITGMDPPEEIESALAAINTAHNEVSAAVSLARATADQKIEQSKRAVEIETMRGHAEVEPLLRLSEQLRELKSRSSDALAAYLRKIEIDLLSRAKRIITEVAS
jgi:regulator of protease activity HflC (stomatin/prohibitin superfamily)